MFSGSCRAGSCATLSRTPRIGALIRATRFAALALLTQSGLVTAQCSAAFDMGDMGPLVANFGNLVTYLRLLGLVPPTSG